MRYKNRYAIIVGVVLLAALSLQGRAQDRPEEKLLQEAKLLIFDAKYAPALERLDKIIDRYPDSPSFGKALFYRGECLTMVGGRERDALRAYKNYLKSGAAKGPEANESLIEQAERGIIDLSYALYAKGDKEAIRDVEDRLSHSNKTIRYYAAYELSFCKDHRLADKSVPVLQSILETETNPELVDRAKIALLRVDPRTLERMDRRHEDRTVDRRARVLRIRIGGKDGTRVDLSLPMALADLALSAISDEDKALLKRKGYDPDRILEDLERGDGTVFEVTDAQEGTTFKIWIEIRKEEST
jgi:hypothetical protein